MLRTLEQLKEMALQKQPKRIAVVFPHDQYVMDAVISAYQLGVIKPVLIGDQYIMTELLASYNDMKIIHETNPEKASFIAMQLVNDKEVDIIMKGLIDTHRLLKAVVNDKAGIKQNELLSHVGLLQYQDLNRVLFVTDGAMNIEPSVKEKIAIIENVIELVQKLDDDKPKVGLVSAVEKVNVKMRSTVDAKDILLYYREKKILFDIDGPFAIDNLISLESVLHKDLTGSVAGQANVLVFPNIETGNVFYKTSVFLAHAISAGIVVGAKVPIVLTSRADNETAKLYSIYLAVVVA